jgi:predicted membrane protein
MKFINPFKSFSPQETILLIAFIIYLVFPIQTPSFLNGVVDSPIGMITIFIITISLFLYTNPILAILYLFVAYELLRRSSHSTVSNPKTFYNNNENIPTLNEIDLQHRGSGMNSIQISRDTTLEEDVVNKMSPIGVSDASEYTYSEFKPFADNIKGASSV